MFPSLFDRAFLPHGHCFFWKPDILWLHVGSDAGIAAAYLVIPLALVRIVRRRRDLDFNWMFLLFSMFILLCGISHLMGIVVLWKPYYRLEGWLKLATALASIPTAALLLRLVPDVVALPSVAKMRETEADLREANARLADRVSDSERQYRILAESVPQLVWTTDPNGAVTFVNQRWVAFTGLTVEQARNGEWIERVHPSERETLAARVQELFQSGAAWETEHRFLHAPTGEYRWQLVRGEPVHDDMGRITLWVGSTTDIHERRLLEESLRASEQALRALTDTMPQLVWSTRPDGHHDFFNQAWYRFTGMPVGSTDGEGWSHLLHPEDRPRTLEIWNRCLETGEPYEINYRFRQAATGQYRWFIGRANPLRDARGNIIRWMGTCTDIHDEKINAERLARANQDLEHFGYAASHDLQEPLRTILLYSQLFQQRHSDSLDETGRTAIQAIMSSATRMMALLKDLRVLLRSGRETDHDRPVLSSSEVAQQVLDDLRAAQEEANATVIVDPLPDLRIERSHFAQVIQNLVTNALRYRGEKPAHVHIGAERIGGRTTFFVQDRGEGIAPEYHERIFQAFQRLHGPRVAGSGLGLTICGRIVASYGGSIWVESSAGEGARFLFTLPDAEIPTEHDQTA
jgi:PAS domain S-box-containing protein